MTEMTELKPCPLCGGPVAIDQVEVKQYECRTVIRCVCCGLTLDWTQNFVEAPRRPFAPSDDGERVCVTTNLSVVDAWNRRVGVE